MGFWDKLSNLFGKKDKDDEEQEDLSQYMSSQDKLIEDLQGIRAEYDAAVEAGKHNIADEMPEDPGYEYMTYEGPTKEDIERDTQSKYNSQLADKLAQMLIDYESKSGALERDKSDARADAEIKSNEVDRQISREKKDAETELEDRGLGRSSIYYESGKSYDEAAKAEKQSVADNLQKSLAALDIKIDELAQQKDAEQTQTTNAYMQKIAEETKTLLSAMQKQLDSISKYNNSLKEKEVKYKKDRADAIKKQIEDEAKAEQELEKFERKYGYTGDKQRNYEQRLQKAIEYYTSLPKSVAIKLANGNSKLADYLGLYMPRLISAIERM